ncbi:SH3 domain-containing protein [Mesorhizobium sp. ES1-1]|uniref:SH3 domain-containing protein n=1 Tax=Mesorhizobium sp. ES1-1 TaxID=2876629 RepID=UPI001CCFACC4|nr:SH3 domain-containing protein [Mesorhizobium sp. ES1-1]MBZ9674476.1 SH3 domain-containing protein [Mesorhizobium sp. ES1-1]
MQFGYDMRPSFWQEVRSKSHLVIAAIGTAALLGVAAVALWLAMPAGERQAAASAEQAIPAVRVKTTKIAPAATVVATTASPGTTRKSDAVVPKVAAAEANIPALPANDPRWTSANPKAASATADADQNAPGQVANQAQPAPDKAAAFAASSDDTNATDELAKVAAPAPTAGSTPDGAQTAAIPAAKPAAGDDAGKTKAAKTVAAGNGLIVRAVTMRSGPKKNAAAIQTIPARTSVQVLSCKQWCQIVHNGKTGWVYKSYIKI